MELILTQIICGIIATCLVAILIFKMKKEIRGLNEEKIWLLTNQKKDENIIEIKMMHREHRELSENFNGLNQTFATYKKEKEEEIAKLNQILNEKEVVQQKLAEDNRSLVETRQELNKNLDRVDRMFRDFAEAVENERKTQVAKFEQRLHEHEKEVQTAKLNQLLHEKETQVAKFNQLLHEKETQVAKFNQLLHEKEAESAKLKQILNEKEVVQQKLAEENRSLVEKRQELNKNLDSVDRMFRDFAEAVENDRKEKETQIDELTKLWDEELENQGQENNSDQKQMASSDQLRSQALKNLEKFKKHERLVESLLKKVQHQYEIVKTVHFNIS